MAIEYCISFKIVLIPTIERCISYVERKTAHIYRAKGSEHLGRETLMYMSRLEWECPQQRRETENELCLLQWETAVMVYMYGTKVIPSF